MAENKNRARFDRRRPAAHQLQVFSNFRLLWFVANYFETVWLPSTLHKLIKMRMIFSRCATASSAPSCRCLTSLSGRVVDDCLTIRFHFLFFFCIGHFFTFTLSMQAEFLFLQGFVKARLAMFDKPTPKPSRKLVSGSRHFQEIINNWWFNFNSE